MPLYPDSNREVEGTQELAIWFVRRTSVVAGKRREEPFFVSAHVCWALSRGPAPQCQTLGVCFRFPRRTHWFQVEFTPGPGFTALRHPGSRRGDRRSQVTNGAVISPIFPLISPPVVLNTCIYNWSVRYGGRAPSGEGREVQPAVHPLC